ncbi:MAG: hypothetical protein NT012_02805 [Candidatus Nealsonbacteria bacterium]|jgi:hypothetical protein|nr:hypothetical protein [Candidatus Nealsonbacteria bacterium]
MLVRLNKVKIGDKFMFSSDVEKKLRIHGTFRASVPYTNDKILIRKESSKKGYLLEYFKTGTLLKDVKTGQVWKFPNEVLGIVNQILLLNNERLVG